jgi:hypothetical protein
MTEKIIGYTLLFTGLIVIAGASMSVYQVFTGKSQPVQVFSFPSLKIDPSAFTPQVDFTDQLPEELQGVITRNQPNAEPHEIELFPADMLNTMANTGAHLMLMSFIVTVGFRVAELGVKLTRPIVVRLNQRKESPSIQ